MSFQKRSWFSRPGVLLGEGLVFVLLSGAARAQTTERVESLLMSPESNSALNSAVALSGDHPEPEWNRVAVTVGGYELRSLTPNFDAGDATALRQSLDLTKVLVPDLLRSSNGAFAELFAEGQVYAIELDVFPDDPAAMPAAGQRLPVIGVLQGLDPNGHFANLGQVYLYDEALYHARVSQLMVARMNMPLEEHTIWLDSVVWAGSTSIESILLWGVSNRIEGGLSANGSVCLGGQSNVVLDPVEFAGAYVQTGQNHQIDSLASVPLRPVPTAPHAGAWYRERAIEANQLFTGAVTITADANQAPLANGLPVTGVVYATGPIDVSGPVRGQLTLVSEAAIGIGAGVAELTGAVDEMLALLVGGGSITISASAASLTGSLIAPVGDVSIAGSGNLIVGQVVADTVSMTGGWNVVSDGTY